MRQNPARGLSKVFAVNPASGGGGTWDEPPHHREMLVPLNKLLFDEQVALVHAAEASAKAGIPSPHPLPFRPSPPGYRPPGRMMPETKHSRLINAMGSTRSPVELSWA